MARCWTCGKHVSGYSFTCGWCDNSSVLEDLRNRVSEQGLNLTRVEHVLNEGFARNSEQLAEIAWAIQWGFSEVAWQLEQQSEILKSLDRTLKTPSQTQAEEWRAMAEELRYRGSLPEAEEFFLKALSVNRLDYRIYIGLAETYLLGNDFSQARAYLERSLPHAPKTYKSYSLRLIGHIHACGDDYQAALNATRQAIDFSPTYSAVHYDNAQYCAQVTDVSGCLTSLRKAVELKPNYWQVAWVEQNFGPARAEVNRLLSEIDAKVQNSAREMITKAEGELASNAQGIEEAQLALDQSRDNAPLQSRNIRVHALRAVEEAKEKLLARNLEAHLEGASLAQQSLARAEEATIRAHAEKRYFLDRRKLKNEKFTDGFVKNLLPASAGFGLLGYLVFGLGGCVVRVLHGYKNPSEPFSAWDSEALIGIMVGIIGGILHARMEARREAERL